MAEGEVAQRSVASQRVVGGREIAGASSRTTQFILRMPNAGTSCKYRVYYSVDNTHLSTKSTAVSLRCSPNVPESRAGQALY